MKKESVVLSFIAVVIGILVSGVAFYLYQSTKTISPSKVKTVSIAPTSPTPASSIQLTVDQPKDEDVTDSKTVTVSGHTQANATVIITTLTEDLVVTPTKLGSFSTTVTIGNDQNPIEITAVGPDGQETKITRTITYSTESF